VVRTLPEAEQARLEARRDVIARRYDELSSVYQASKDDNDIPLS
jgi:hypothetical protein